MEPDIVRQQLHLLTQELAEPKNESELLKFASMHIDNTEGYGMDQLLNTQLGLMMNTFALGKDGRYDTSLMPQVRERYEAPTQKLVAKTILLMTYETYLNVPVGRRVERQAKLGIFQQLIERVRSVMNQHEPPLTTLLTNTFTFPTDRYSLPFRVDEFDEIVGLDNSIAHTLIQEEITHLTANTQDTTVQTTEQAYYNAVVDTTYRYLYRRQGPNLPPSQWIPPPTPPPGGGKDDGGGPGLKKPGNRGGPGVGVQEPVEPLTNTDISDLRKRLHG